MIAEWEPPLRSSGNAFVDRAIRRMQRAVLRGAREDVAASVAGVGRGALRRWKKRYPSLAGSLRRARDRFEFRTLLRVVRNKDWRAQTWTLERTRRQHYAAARAAAEGREAAARSAKDNHADTDVENRRRLLEFLEEHQEGRPEGDRPAQDEDDGGPA